jgi:ankyrin repeat protein
MRDVPLRRLRLGLASLGAIAFLTAASQGAESPVSDAAMRGDTARVRALLKEGADANAAQGDGMSALHWASQQGDVGLVQMLLYAGARVGAVTRNASYTPLHLAARNARAGAVKALLKAGADPNAPTTSGGATPLHYAAGIGSTEAIEALLDAAAKVDVREGAWEQTPLMWAANYGRLAAVELLIARKADVRAITKVENVPEIERAASADRSLRNRRVAALAAAEAPPTAAGGRGAPPAGGRGGAPAMPAREAAGASGSDSTGRDSTERAEVSSPPQAERSQAGRGASSGRGEAEVAQAGRAGRAGGAGGGRGGRGGGGGGGGAGPARCYGVKVGNKGGHTPRHLAARAGTIQIGKALRKAGAPVGQASAGDHTSPLLMATINGHFDIAMLLLEHGASPNQMSDAAATPLYSALNVQWAAKSLYPQPTAQKQQQATYLELMEALLKLGADPNARLSKHLWYTSYNFDLLGVNTTGASPFWRAAYGTDVPAMRLLLRYGADPSIPTKKPVGRMRGADAPAEDEGGDSADPSGLAPIPNGGPGVYPIHAASGVGYGEGYAANAHMHAPDGWLPSVKFLIEELGVDVNSRDHNGFTPLHHAAARGDNELIMYLMEKGADISAVSRRGQTVADMANGPVQRIPPFVETVKLLEKLGSKNSNKCRSC